MARCRTAPVPSSVIITDAPITSAPEESVTVPTKVPDVVCPVITAIIRRTAAAIEIEFLNCRIGLVIVPPQEILRKVVVQRRSAFGFMVPSGKR